MLVHECPQAVHPAFVIVVAVLSMLHCPPVCCRFLRSWSFQSKLGIITNTLFEAAPQLAHLLIVIFSCIVLFAGLAYIGLGQWVPYHSSYAASLEETFRSLFGLGYVKLWDVFPDITYQSPPQRVLSLLIFYGREMIFVMVLVQYFMATLGKVFMQLKRQKLGAKGSSIARDILRVVLPEARSKFTRQLLGAKYSTKARDVNGAAVVVPSGSEALHAFFKAHCPQMIASKAFGDRSQAIQIRDKYLSLPVLQQLLADLAVTDAASSEILMQTRPAKRYSQQQASNSSTAAAGSSDQQPAASGEVWSEGIVAAAATATAGVLLRQDVSRAAAAAGGAAAAVAAALAAAEQLMGSCGKAVDTKELEEAHLQLEGVMQAVDMELRAGADFTTEVRMLVQAHNVVVGLLGCSRGGCQALTYNSAPQAVMLP